MTKKKKTAPKVLAAANEVLIKSGIFDNAYFKALKSGVMTKEQFCWTQAQFYYAVVFFSRPMAALVARIPEASDRLDILHNVVEEHGDLEEHKFHATTFKKLLTLLGEDISKLDELHLSPAVRAFNSVLITSCTFDEIEVAIAEMGMIELAFSTISSMIGKSVVESGWIHEKDLVHYNVHEILDVEHSLEFFAVVEKYWSDTRRQYFIRQGLELGCYIFDRLYRDLWRFSKESGWSE